jgi:hypothetical protein
MSFKRQLYILGIWGPGYVSTQSAKEMGINNITIYTCTDT